MSALSTPSGGGTTAQSKPTSSKQKYQKLDINSLYCTNKNENSEPSSVKSQLSRKHGMQSLGKVPSTRRPPANLPSLKTETGQDPNANSISTTSTSVSSPPTCISQTMPTTASSVAGAGAGSGGWVPLPPPSSPHFRTEFPSLEAAAQPSHRPDHSTPQPQLRPQTEGSWTCGGSAGGRPEGAASPAAAAAPAAAVQTPAYRAILPSFLVKGSSGGGLGLGGLGMPREPPRGGPGPRGPPRAPATPRAVELLTARPILREEQISSLDDMSRDAGWAQHDDIDYDQKLDFSDGESSAPNKGNNRNNNRASIENERVDQKLHEPGDEDQLWAERRQKQNNEVAQAVARARQRKEEEQRRQMRDPPASLPSKDFRDKGDRDRDRNDNREREDTREKDRHDRDRDRTDVRDRIDRQDIRDKDRNDRDRDTREKDRVENRDRMDNRDRFDNRDRERDVRDRDRDRDKVESRDRGRNDNRDRQERQENEKERMDGRDRERNDNRDRNENRERTDRDRFDRERDRPDRERERDRDRERERDRERGDRERNERDRDRDRDFRDRDARDREYNRERDQNNPAFSKSFQANIPPRFLKQQQNRQQDEPQHKGWAFTGKPAPRRQEAPPYNAQRHPPHNGRRSYSRDYSDREDDFRREKEGSGPQWRSEMQDYERSGRELDRSNSKDSYKDFSDYKGKNESDRKSLETAIDQSSRSAAEKLSEVFERKSIGIIEPFASSDSSQTISLDRRSTPPSNVSRRESSEKDYTKATNWAEVTQEESDNVLKSAIDKVAASKDPKPLNPDTEELKRNFQSTTVPPLLTPASNVTINAMTSQNQSKFNSHTSVFQQTGNNNQQQLHTSAVPVVQPQPIASASQVQTTIPDNQNPVKLIPQLMSNTTETFASQIQKQSSEHLPQSFAKAVYPQKSDKEVEIEPTPSKPSIDPTPAMKMLETLSTEVAPAGVESAKRAEDKRNDMHGNIEQVNRIPGKEPIERKSSGSGSEKKPRSFGGGGGYAVYNRGWGPRESRGRRSHRSSRSNNRASESDGSTDGTQNMERKERRRAPRSPRGPKKSDRAEETRGAAQEPPLLATDGFENREPFAPRGQPSRRGRGGFQGASRPPAPAKRVTGYGPPNTKSPFSQANRAVKENEEAKDNQSQVDDKGRGNSNKPRAGSTTGRGRDRRPKGAGGLLSGEEDNWETTSEHSEGGGTGSRRRSVPGRQQGQSQKGPGGRNQNSKNPNNARGNVSQGVKKDNSGDNKTVDITEAMTDLKLSGAKKDDEVVDDGFQEVRNKKNSKEARGPSKEENQQAAKQQPRSHSNQGGGRNGSSSRNPNDKSNTRGSAQVPGKNPQYDRQRQANLAPRFVKQRQKQQLGLVGGYGPDTGAAPPPPAVNAWDKPLRGAPEEPLELTENKSAHSSQRSTPAEALNDSKIVPPPIAVPGDKSGVLDGTTPPVETIIFENTNYKTVPSEEALQQKYQMNSNVAKPQTEEISAGELEARSLPFNGEVRSRPRSIQELIGDSGRPATDAESPSLGLQMSFETAQKAEDSSDMKLDFAFDSDLGQLTEDKSAKTLGMPRSVHMSASNTISPLAADLNLKIASVKKVWEMPAVAEGGEEMQFAGFEESGAEAGAPPNVCKVKPTQQLQSPPPQLYNHVGYQGGYGGGLSVPSPPAMLFNSSQQLVGSSQQLPAQGGLYGAFLDQSRGQFGGFPPAPYAAGSAAPYNYQPPPDMFQSLPNQYRMAATAGGGAAFGQSGQLGNSPSTVLISSTSNSLMSATVKPSSQQIGAIGSKGGGVGGVGGVGSVSAYQQQYLGYGAPDAGYSLQGLVPRAPASSYYSYQPAPAQQPSYPLQFTQPAQSQPFNSQFLSSAQLQVAAAVQQMQQQYRAPLQQQYAPQPQQRPPPQQQMKSPLHEHANGFAPLCDAASPTPKGVGKGQKAPHSPPHHKYHAPPHPPPAHTPHQHHQQQMVSGGNGGRCGGGPPPRPGMAPRYPAPIQRPHAPALPLYRAPQHPPPPPRHHAPRANPYYQHHQRNGGGGGERAPDTCEPAAGADEPEPPVTADVPSQPDLKAE